LMPSDNYRGARRDVIELLQRINFAGPLRWPGGCYSSVAAEWMSGLLPPDERPPVQQPPGNSFCYAAPGGLLGYTDGMTEDWPGLEEYLAICEEIGAEPAIGLKVQFGDSAEVRSAAQLVEYCNGDARSGLGALRAQRGRTEPYGVRKWYLGNEMGIQRRFRRFENGSYHAPPVEPASAAEYAEIAARYAAALLAVDPGLQLIAANFGPNMSVRTPWEDRLAVKWTPPVLKKVGASLWAHSFHLYMRQPNVWTPVTMRWSAKQAERKALTILRYFRLLLSQAEEPRGHGASSERRAATRISLDEWSIGPPWSTEEWGTPQALFGASFLTLLLDQAVPLGLASANYYEPINDGAIQAPSDGVSLSNHCGDLYSVSIRSWSE